MKGKFILPIFVLIVFSLISIRPKAQTQCNCWPVKDTSYHVVPFNFAAAPYYRNDDDYTNQITLPFSFCFYGTSVSQIYINNNGFITWGPSASSADAVPFSYQPVTFPNSVAPMIAPFWADVYTVGEPGIVWYSITPTHIIVQWDSVGGYGMLASASSYDQFEVIITNGSDPIIPNGDNIEFCYGEMNWCVGTASGGLSSGFGGTNPDPAVVGINLGNGTQNIQYGLFNTPSTTYSGPYPSSPYDGVYWLDNQSFTMNGCTGHLKPQLGGVTMCPVDTFYVCEFDTLKVPLSFYSLVSGVSVNSALLPPTPSGVSIIYNVSAGQKDSLVIQAVGNSSNLGYNTVDFYGYDNLGDTNFAWFVFKVSPSPIVSINAVPDTICQGSSTVLTAGGGLTYLWSTGATTASITVTPTVTTTYSIVIATSGCNKDTSVTVVVEPAIALAVSPANTGACASGAITLTATGANSYSWAPNSGLSCYTCASPVANPTVTTIYTITGTSSGCTANITDTVHVYPAPTVTVTASADSVCVGTPITLTASGTATTYSWTPSSGLSCTNCANPTATPSGSIVYTVTGMGSDGCSSTAAVAIYVFALPILSVSPNVSICPGRSVSLFATGNGSSFTWSPGNETGPFLTVTPTSTETWSVTMTSGCGDTTASVTVNVNPQPVPSFYADVEIGCAPLCIQFRNTSTVASGSITSSSWDFGTGDTSNSKNPIYCYANSGVYSVKITTTSDSGCSSTLSVNNLITVYSNPNAAFTVSPQPTNMLDPTIVFTDHSTDVYGIAGWNWKFGDATDSTGYLQDAVHTYQDTGTYCATLTVTNIHGCVDSATNCLVISPDFCLYIPDAFTPNGDGKNDVFEAKGNDVRSFEMYIFDRWGMQLFHSTNINDGWNGEVNNGGAICQEDAYVYLINVDDTKNHKHTYMGRVNLIK